MGVLSDIIVAQPEDAPAIFALNGQHDQQFPTLPCKGIDMIKLGHLAQIFAKQRSDDLDAVENYMTDALVAEQSNDGPWIYAIPADLVQSLASLDDAGRARISSQWAETEEFILSGWLDQDVADYLNQLATLAQRATREHKRLLLWFCL